MKAYQGKVHFSIENTITYLAALEPGHQETSDGVQWSEFPPGITHKVQIRSIQNALKCALISFCVPGGPRTSWGYFSEGCEVGLKALHRRGQPPEETDAGPPPGPDPRGGRPGPRQHPGGGRGPGPASQPPEDRSPLRFFLYSLYIFRGKL